MLSKLSTVSRIATRETSRLAARSSTSTLMKRGYHDSIVEHYENPRNVGSLDKNDDNVGTVSIISVLDIKMSDETAS